METAWKCTHVPKQCPSMYTVYKECPSSSSSVQGVSKLVHMLCTNLALAWAHVYISKQFPSLGTPTSTAMLVLKYSKFSQVSYVAKPILASVLWRLLFSWQGFKGLSRVLNELCKTCIYYHYTTCVNPVSQTFMITHLLMQLNNTFTIASFQGSHALECEH